MSILIINRGTLALRPYHEWLADHGGDLLLVTSAADHGDEPVPSAGHDYAEVIALPDFSDPDQVLTAALRLAEGRRINVVVACQERDLVCAAQVRQRLAVPGQDVASATAFRDKATMKRLCQQAGLAVARHQVVTDRGQLVELAAEFGFPLVVKPRDGLSSVGLEILADAVDLLDYQREVDPTGMLVEQFVPGEMFHIDGLVLAGQVVVAWPSKYDYQLANFAVDDGPRLDAALAADDPLTQRLLDFTDQVLAALPTPACTTFHAEVFHTPDDQLVLCEIASRNGGAMIKGVLHAMFGVDLPSAWVQAAVGLPIPVPAPGVRMSPTGTAGQCLLLRRPHLRWFDDQPPWPWVHRFEQYLQPGEVSGNASSSGDFAAALVVWADDWQTCQDRLNQVGDWYLQRAKS